jgi:CRP-like cAMP-binding protein
MARLVEVEALRQIPLFATLDEDDLARVRAATTVRHYHRGDIVAAHGEPHAPLCFVRSGVIKLFATSPEGKEQVLRLVAAGKTFNAVAALDGKPSPAGAAAVEPSVVYMIEGAEVRRLVAERPSVAQAAVRTLASAVREVVGLAEELSLYHVTQRIAKLLLNQEQYTCERCRAHRLTQQEMAAVVGTAREVVGRALRDLQLAGAVSTRRGGVVVLDRERLRLLAG